jgi:hypothetical protein
MHLSCIVAKRPKGALGGTHGMLQGKEGDQEWPSFFRKEVSPQERPQGSVVSFGKAAAK